MENIRRVHELKGSWKLTVLEKQVRFELFCLFWKEDHKLLVLVVFEDWK